MSESEKYAFPALVPVFPLTLRDGAGSICGKITVIQAGLLQSLLLYCSVSHLSLDLSCGTETIVSECK